MSGYFLETMFYIKILEDGKFVDPMVRSDKDKRKKVPLFDTSGYEMKEEAIVAIEEDGFKYQDYFILESHYLF